MAAFEFGNYPQRPGRPGFGGPPAQDAPPAQNTPPSTQVPAQAPAFGASEHTVAPSHVRPPGLNPPLQPPVPPHLRSEPLLAFKIYDSCRHKNCLGVEELGNARNLNGGGFVTAPRGAQSVHIENLRVRRIVIANKEANPLMPGHWDLEIRYVFHYDLRFTGEGNKPLGTVEAQNNFTRRCTLFGSIGSEVAMATDLFGQMDTTMGGEPFVMVEARAIALAADLVHRHGHGHGLAAHQEHDLEQEFMEDDAIEAHHGHHGHHHRRRGDHVSVTIGLFSIIKLYRLVSLQVESRGFVIPPPCGDICPPNPCEIFEEKPFPMDDFAPPQKPEFEARANQLENNDA